MAGAIATIAGHHRETVATSSTTTWAATDRLPQQAQQPGTEQRDHERTAGQREDDEATMSRTVSPPRRAGRPRSNR